MQTNLQTAGAGLSALTTALAAAGQPGLIAGCKAFDDAVSAVTSFVNNNPRIGQEVDMGVIGGLGYFGYQVLKGMKNMVAKWGPQAPKDVNFADAGSVPAADGAIPLTGAAEGPLVAVLSKLNALLLTLSVSGDTMKPPDGFHYVPGGFGKIAPNDPGYVTSADGSENNPLHVIVKNMPAGPAPGPTMPTGPTSPQAASSMPKPGKGPPR